MWPSGRCPPVLLWCCNRVWFHVTFICLVLCLWDLRFSWQWLGKLMSSGMWRREEWQMYMDISEATAATVIRVVVHIYQTTRRHPRRREYWQFYLCWLTYTPLISLLPGYWEFVPIPVGVRSSVCGRWLAGIAGSNPAGGRGEFGCLLWVLCVVG